MINFDDGSIDPNIKFLIDTINSGTPLNLVNGSKNGKDVAQTYIIQWDGIVQHFDSGRLAMIGVAAQYGLSQACAELDSDIMKSISTYHLLYNLDKQLSFYDLIYELHKSKYPQNTWDNWKSIVKTVETDIDELIKNDTEGLIFQISPFLSVLNALKNMYIDNTISSAIFVLNESLCINCHKSPFIALSKFFEQNPERPIYIDLTNLTFDEYMKKYTREHSSLANHVIITDNNKFIWDTIENPNINGVSILMPYNPVKNLTDQVAKAASDAKMQNEYIVYTNKPLTV